MADLDVTGLSELRGRFSELPNRLMKNVLKSSLRQAANVVKDEAKSRVPVSSGALKSSIRVISRRGSPTSVLMSVVAGDLTGKQQSKFGQKSAFYALFVEKGSVNMAAHPFMKPAIESKAQAAIDVMVQAIGDKLADQVK